MEQDNTAQQAGAVHDQLRELFAGRDEYLDTVLRGHLFLEQLLDRALVPWFPQVQYFERARLSFSQKLQLARALNLRHPDEPIWNAISALNTLRNDFAHRLTSGEREQKIRTFIEITRSDFPEAEYVSDDKNFSPLEQMSLALAYIAGSLDQIGTEYERRASMGTMLGRVLLWARYGWRDPKAPPP